MARVDNDTSLLDVVVLIVVAESMNVWIGAENPFNGMKDFTDIESLRRYEIAASSLTILFGIAASTLSKRSTPVVASVLIAGAMSWLYEWEWSRAHIGEGAQVPYRIRKMGTKYEVMNTKTKRIHSYHATKKNAQAQVRLLRGIEHGFKPTKRRLVKRRKR